MKHLVISPHFRTTNIYSRRTILVNNVANCRNFKSDPQFVNLPAGRKREVQRIFNRQISLLRALDKEIAIFEQTSFPFGGFASKI